MNTESITASEKNKEETAAKTRPGLLKYCPIVPLIFYGLFLLGLIVTLIARLSPAFADFFSRYISSGPRMVLAKLTAPLPFSLAEFFVLSMPILLITLFRHANRRVGDTWQDTLRYCLSVLSVAALIFAILMLNFSCGYFGTTLDQKLGIDREAVSAEDLKATATILLDHANELADEVDYRYGSFSVMPYSLSDLNDKLNDAYEKVYDKYEFLSRLKAPVKPVMLSKPWTYTHIAGVYTFFTGEANINTNFPDYTLPYTAAHEMAHQRGIAREEEANFVAFLVCKESDDPYIRYSAYVSVYEYVASSLYSASHDAYFDVLAGMDMRIRCELIAYDDFFDQYRENTAATVTGTVNNAYLQSQGQSEGIRSYGLVVDLAVAYYRSGNE